MFHTSTSGVVSWLILSGWFKLFRIHHEKGAKIREKSERNESKFVQRNNLFILFYLIIFYICSTYECQPAFHCTLGEDATAPPQQCPSSYSRSRMWSVWPGPLCAASAGRTTSSTGRSSPAGEPITSHQEADICRFTITTYPKLIIWRVWQKVAHELWWIKFTGGETVKSGNKSN